MIISASIRTDLPAFYSKWFLNRIREGYVLVRNPYNQDYITRYQLDPSVVDCLFFCTKNPTPLLPHLEEIADYRWMWHVTLTPYGKDIEPNVPHKRFIVEQFKKLSDMVNAHNGGEDAVQWRYDPICITGRYTVEQHIKSFEVMATLLEGYTRTCIISFVDIFNCVTKNFPELRPVCWEDQVTITKAFVEIGGQHGIAIKTCVENGALAEFGADCSGCTTPAVFETALGLPTRGLTFTPPKKKFARDECSACVVGGDIGNYSNCPHLCKYCYANYGKDQVLQKHKTHDPESPLIIGNLRPGEIVHPAKQESWIKKKPSVQPDLFEI
ncbi:MULTISPECIES: DUF1848 domain-containing protein [unclassified Fibrobacter]|uniref:DUF1848 domain-containing protein n=1 Tax=unclassified Fibrobacter TaxID=2634177 RepID=UPI000D6CC1D6|nr:MULTISPECIES: DUF1848 domain-containing protein [unclassified Fibrobacter]PWJ69064.1 uncharacterized protein DUF1848 [Fibrobacter sp. UWR4]PZW72895.1 uncharacterized protein DUF1848 [Fibrobacter sp. UWR1]